MRPNAKRAKRQSKTSPSHSRKLKLVLSDFHLGTGQYLPDGSVNPLEDFHWDGRFEEFLDYYSTGEYEDAEIELVFNGDMLNLILTDYHGHFTVVITEAVSTEKLQSILRGHAVFFAALKKFLKHPKRSLTYIVGNHDQEMLWKATRELFEKAVDSPVQWKNTYYQVDGMHIEHGHQYETINRIDPTRLFLTEDLPEPILNLPWGTLFAVQFIIKLKMQRPYVDKVRPFRMLIWWSLFHDTYFTLVHLVRLLVFFFSTRFSKNRYRQSSLGQTLRILRECSFIPELTDAAKGILRNPEIHTVVFGHTHAFKHVQFAEGKQYINLGTWNDTLSLDLANYGKSSRLTYLRVDYSNVEATQEPKPLSRLRHWIGTVPAEEEAVGF